METIISKQLAKQHFDNQPCASNTEPVRFMAGLAAGSKLASWMFVSHSHCVTMLSGATMAKRQRKLVSKGDDQLCEINSVNSHKTNKQTNKETSKQANK